MSEYFSTETNFTFLDLVSRGSRDEDLLHALHVLLDALRRNIPPAVAL